MTTATIDALSPPAPTARPRVTMADVLRRLGELPADRVRFDPVPGQATLEDLMRANEQRTGPTCEWVDGTLVEKAMGFHESWLAFIIIGQVDAYLQTNNIGMCTAPDGVMKILPDIGRAPDVAFIPWEKLKDGKPPAREDKVPAIVPDLVIEVLSASNTPAEMARKRDEYFRAGVKLVWEIEPASHSANVFTGPNAVAPVPADGTLDGEPVLPGFTLSLRDLFARADRRS